jgi:NAD(P)-dependent dehydrogenase (short-subunit alcohol dehydrogenase family)
MAGSKLIIVLGSGPGIGVGVASHFASQNFDRVALLSRNAERLNSDVAAVSEAARGANRSDVTVKPYPVDVSDMASLERVLRQVVQELGKPEVVVYNAAALKSGKFFEATEEDVNRDFKASIRSRRWFDMQHGEPYFCRCLANQLNRWRLWDSTAQLES